MAISVRGAAMLLVLSSQMSAALARGAEDDWQGGAKSFTEGPLCSLVLQVKPRGALHMVAPGGVCDAGHGCLAPTPIPLGCLALTNSAAPTRIERSGDWSGSKAVAVFEGGRTLTVHASQLSAGIAIQTSGANLLLFGGDQHDRMVTFPDGKMKLHSPFHAGKPGKGTITPTYAAVPLQNGVKVCPANASIPAPTGGEWTLVWWGKASHFLRTTSPVTGDGNLRASHTDAYHADCPLLLVFDATPVSLTVAQGGGIECAFDKPSRCAVVLPLLGAAHVQAETTEKWADGLPEDILARCQALASFARQYPLSARESFAYDESKDEAALTETVSFLELGSGGRKAAPLPPIAALAMKQGLPITVSAKLTELDLTTEFGPLVAAADTDTVTWTVRGLGKYVKQSRRVGNDAKPPATLEAELEAQVKKLLEAGPLAPWVFEDHFSKARGDYYWAEPGEVLYLLSEVHPVVGEQQQAALLRSMADLRAACPPPSVPVLAPDKGSRRGGYDTGPCPLSRQVLKERGKRVSLFALYGLARCCELTDTKPTQAEWEECKKVLAGAFQEQGWATLYLLGHPGRFVWPGYSVQPKEELETSRFWLGDRPGTVVNANRQFAGAVGAARLTRLAGDKAAEQQAWWMLARSAVLRVALGKYPAWRYDARLAVIPPKPDWAWQTRRNFSPGLLETLSWSKPQDDVRQVTELAPDLVNLGDSSGPVDGNSRWNQTCMAQLPAFRDMVPELSLLLAEHLRPECAALVERIAWNHPIWYASFAEAVLGHEHNMNHPSDAFQVFLARAQVLGEKPDQLTRWIDVPWTERGDLFYLNKLAETIKAYRGVTRTEYSTKGAER